MSQTQIITITSSPEGSFWSLLHPAYLVRGIAARRHLVGQFVWWHLQEQHRGSLLGLLWMIVTPLLALSVYTVVFSVLLRGRVAVWTGLESDLEVAMMIFAGLVVFGVFSETTGRATRLMWANYSYVKKIVFPLEILPVTIVGAAVIQSLISLALLIAMRLLFDGTLSWTVLYLPLVYLPLIALVAGLAWLISALGVFVRDLANVVQVGIRVMFFLTAVVYPMEVVSRNLPASLQWIFHLNPLSTMVEDLRRVMLKDLPPEWSWYLPTVVACLGIMLVGYAWFMHTKREFADVI